MWKERSFTVHIFPDLCIPHNPLLLFEEIFHSQAYCTICKINVPKNYHIYDSYLMVIVIMIINNLFLSFNHLSNCVIENSSMTEIHQFYVCIKTTLYLK